MKSRIDVSLGIQSNFYVKFWLPFMEVLSVSFSFDLAYLDLLMSGHEAGTTLYDMYE